MSKIILNEIDESGAAVDPFAAPFDVAGGGEPVHVIYGGADRYSAETPAKLGRLAAAAMDKWAPDADVFAKAMGLSGDGDPAAAVYERTLAKLNAEPIEDLRIDLEDGYGFRPDEEEDADAVRSAAELAKAFAEKTITRHCGFRIKSFAPETRRRAERTLEIFTDTFFAATKGELPPNFVVTLPKISEKHEIADLCEMLDAIEKKHGVINGRIGVELVIETPLAIIDHKGRCPLKKFVKAADGRCTSAHLGAYDYTSLLGISADRQDIRHPACGHARSVMLAALAPLGIRLSDSVTTLLPMPIHKGDGLTDTQISENEAAVHAGWRRHFENVTASMSDGFYQSWDLHPNQLPARFAAVFAFYLRAKNAQAARLKSFVANATKASMTGNTFDDAASVHGILTFFKRGMDCGAFTREEVAELTGL
jgi:citrate lyase beta subunit